MICKKMHNTFLGLGGRYKISKRVTINAEYHAHMNRVANSKYKNPFL